MGKTGALIFALIIGLALIIIGILVLMGKEFKTGPEWADIEFRQPTVFKIFAGITCILFGLLFLVLIFSANIS